MTVKRFIANHYGGKKAFLKDIIYRLMYITGCFSRYRRVNWHKVKRLVFICKGNICRSPYAEYHARGLGLSSISVGLVTVNNRPANQDAMQAAVTRGVDLGSHKTTEINSYKYQSGDLLIGFEPWHIKSLKLKTASHNMQVTLLGLWSQHAHRPYIHDPYGLSRAYFDSCFSRIDDAVENIASLIKQDEQLNWYRSKKVLVTEADTLGSIAVIRSLGRAGYHVLACSPKPKPLGFESSFVSYSENNPAYEDHSGFLGWLRNFIKEHDVDVIIPSGPFFLAIKPVFSEFAHLLPCSRDADIVYRCLSKYDLFHYFSGEGVPEEIRKNLPAYVLLDSKDKMPEAKLLFEQLGSPLYAKVDAIYSQTNKSCKVYQLNRPDSVQEKLLQLAGDYRRILIQGYVSGIGVGVFFLVWDNTIRAVFMHRRLHEVPYTGGVSSYRCSWWHNAIYNDALKRIEFIRWNGVAMLEYRWDSVTDQFCFIELNSRFWGSLHLALYSGVDFPRLLVDAFLGRPHENVLKFKQNVRCRLTFPCEIQHVWSKLKDKQLSQSTRLLSIVEFVSLSLNPKVYSDMLFAGDRRLYWISIKLFIRQMVKAIAEKTER